MDMAGLAFFDECTERVDEENGKITKKATFITWDYIIYILAQNFFLFLITVMLLELDESQHSERTVFIPPPEAATNVQQIIYDTFKLNPDLMKPQKHVNLKNPVFSDFTIVPGSPMARRTKHEIKIAQKMARKQVIFYAQSFFFTVY